MKTEPLVLCITNTVAANFTANVLLALSAKPVMLEEPSEAQELAAVADAVLINVGTVHPRQADTMRAAILSANAHQVPWVLDPVGCQLLKYRQNLCEEFIALKPTLVRGNQSEIAHIRRGLSPNCPMLATGEVDEIYFDGQVERITGGVERLQTVTATGCAQGAICAAYLGRGMSPVAACQTGSRLMKRAGEKAFAIAPTPGSFQTALLDQLWELTHD